MAAYDYNAIDQQAFSYWQTNKQVLLFPSKPATFAPYRVTFNQAEGDTGQEVAKVICIDHIPCGQNGGRHHLYLSLLNDEGVSIQLAAFRGIDSNNVNHFVRQDKPPNERTNIAMWGGVEWHRVWVVEKGQGIPVEISSVADGLSSRHEADPEGCQDVTRFHHSFYVVFKLDKGTGTQPPPVEPPPSSGCNPAAVDAIKADVTNVQANLNQALADLEQIKVSLERLKGNGR